VGLTTLPYKKRKLLRSLQEIQPDIGRRLWRRPRPKLGCGAKERRRRRRHRNLQNVNEL
jgi:hypothetical protein